MNRMSVRIVSFGLAAALFGCMESPSAPVEDDELSSTEQEIITAADCPAGTPAALAPPADQNLKRILHAAGVQRYRCDALASGGFGWVFVEPEADLFTNCTQVGTHYVGPTWEYKDGTIVTATKIAGVNAPEPLTSSFCCDCVPHRTRVLSLRCVPGVTYASMPMIGLMPASFAVL